MSCNSDLILEDFEAFIAVIFIFMRIIPAVESIPIVTIASRREKPLLERIVLGATFI